MKLVSWVDIETEMTHYPSNIAAFLTGIIFCPPCANTTNRLAAGPDAKRFNRIFDEATDLLFHKCRAARAGDFKNNRQMAALPAEALADLMMALALQMSLIASHLADCQEWETHDFEEILNRTSSLPSPLKSVFKPDLRFWECLLRHRRAPELLDAFESFDELSRIRCVAVLTSGTAPAFDIDRFVEAPDKEAYIAGRLQSASSEIHPDDITQIGGLKQAIAWSINACMNRPTITTSGLASIF